MKSIWWVVNRHLKKKPKTDHIKKETLKWIARNTVPVIYVCVHCSAKSLVTALWMWGRHHSLQVLTETRCCFQLQGNSARTWTQGFRLRAQAPLPSKAAWEAGSTAVLGSWPSLGPGHQLSAPPPVQEREASSFCIKESERNEPFQVEV